MLCMESVQIELTPISQHNNSPVLIDEKNCFFEHRSVFQLELAPVLQMLPALNAKMRNNY